MPAGKPISGSGWLFSRVAVLACLAEACVTSAAAQQAPPPSPPAIRLPPAPEFDPVKPGEVGPVWTYHDAKRPFIVFALLAGQSESRVFTIRNTGPSATGPMHFWIESEDGRGPSRIVKIDRDSDCVTRGVAPGETCSVKLTVTAIADGQFLAHVRFPPGVRNGPSDWVLGTILEINGYGTGFGTKLPDGVVGNGSRCPVIGAPAEIALSTPIGRSVGYLQPDPDRPGFTLSTAGCEKIEFAPGRHNEEGRACARPVVKQYTAPSMAGPWTLSSRRDGGLRAVAMLCENDVLKLVLAR